LRCLPPVPLFSLCWLFFSGFVWNVGRFQVWWPLCFLSFGCCILSGAASSRQVSEGKIGKRRLSSCCSFFEGRKVYSHYCRFSSLLCPQTVIIHIYFHGISTSDTLVARLDVKQKDILFVRIYEIVFMFSFFFLQELLSHEKWWKSIVPHHENKLHP